jgi:hypothetical protein
MLFETVNSHLLQSHVNAVNIKTTIRAALYALNSTGIMPSTLATALEPILDFPMQSLLHFAPALAISRAKEPPMTGRATN